MYLDESSYVRCQLVTGWVNIMGWASGMLLHVASYINTALKMETADSSWKLVSLAIQRITSQKTVSFVNEFCNKSGVFLWLEIQLWNKSKLVSRFTSCRCKFNICFAFVSRFRIAYRYLHFVCAGGENCFGVVIHSVVIESRSVIEFCWNASVFGD